MLYGFAKFTAGFLVIVAVSLSLVIIADASRAGGEEASALQSIKSFFTN